MIKDNRIKIKVKSIKAKVEERGRKKWNTSGETVGGVATNHAYPGSERAIYD